MHGFLPFPHIDHLHPDWGIALAAAANGKEKMEEFNREFGHRLIWMPWQRPGFDLGLKMRAAVEANPGCDGILLGGHGLFTWGQTQHECYLNTISTIDQIGQFIERHGAAKEGRFDLGARRSRHGPGPQSRWRCRLRRFCAAGSVRSGAMLRALQRRAVMKVLTQFCELC